MPHFAYILYSSTSDQYYVGSCSNIDVRLKRHNDGATTSTKVGWAWVVKYTEQFDSKTEALKRENYLKRMKCRVLIENRIANAW